MPKNRYCGKWKRHQGLPYCSVMQTFQLQNQDDVLILIYRFIFSKQEKKRSRVTMYSNILHKPQGMKYKPIA